MAHTGVTTRKVVCAICKEQIATGTLVYFDSSKRQGSHLTHVPCWDTLRKNREPRPKPKEKPERLSTEPLAPPF